MKALAQNLTTLQKRSAGLHCDQMLLKSHSFRSRGLTHFRSGTQVVDRIQRATRTQTCFNVTELHYFSSVIFTWTTGKPTMYVKVQIE